MYQHYQPDHQRSDLGPASAPNLLQLLQRGQQTSQRPPFDHFSAPPPQPPPMWQQQHPHQPPHGGYHVPPGFPGPNQNYARPPDPRQQDILNTLFSNLHR
jgi:hypothetical protein